VDTKNTCPVCKKKIDPTKNFCKYCGNDLRKSEIISEKKEKDELKKASKKEESKIKIGYAEKKTSKKKIIISVSVIASLVFIILIFFISYIFFNFNPLERIAALSETEKEAEETATEETSLFEYYETLREYSEVIEPYPNAPATAFTLAYADLIGGHDFCKNVWQGIKDNWVLAGGSLENLYYFDNVGNFDMSLNNIDSILEKNPDIFVSFQQDLDVNTILSHKFKQRNIPVISLDHHTKIYDYSYSVGPNNFEAGYEMGKYAIDLIRENNTNSDSFKVIALEVNWMAVFVILQEGFYQAFFDEYGDQTNSFYRTLDISELDESQIMDNMESILSYEASGIDNILLFSVLYDGLGLALDKASEIDRFSPDQWIVLTFDAYNENVRQGIRSGRIDATSYNFPEKWGSYIVPAAVSLLNIEPIPEYIYVEESEIVTKENINNFYQ
jgi:ABC-type sugar transport system substrate-binding protein